MNTVRVASESDALAIATVQCDTWWHDYRDLLTGPAGAQLEPSLVAERWLPLLRQAIPGFMVLAMTEEQPVGFAAVDVRDGLAEIHTLIVRPEHRRRGHGSRLMSACADLAQQDGARDGVMWCLETDIALDAFVRSAGWAPDGGARVLTDGEADVREVRYVTTFHTHGR